MQDKGARFIVQLKAVHCLFARIMKPSGKIMYNFVATNRNENQSAELTCDDKTTPALQ